MHYYYKEETFWQSLNSLEKGIAIFLAIIALLICYVLHNCISEYIAYCKSEPIKVEAMLISNDYTPSTLEHHTAYSTTFTRKGVQPSMTSYSTGHSESFITIWDCGKYGRIKCDYEEVWRYAQPQSTVLIKFWHGNAYIEGIVH